jgi:hypothetical protein
MKTSEKFKALEQMGRDKCSLQDILTAIARYREIAESEEAADLEKPKPMPRIRTPGVPPMARPIH